MKLSKKKAVKLAKDIAKEALAKFKQELEGYNEENLDRVLRQYKNSLVRFDWKFLQNQCKWSENDDGPILMPDYTRLYYRKGNTEIILQEFHPQTRLLKFKGALNRAGERDSISQSEASDVVGFSLALPYTTFIFKFVGGKFTEVRCMFCDTPLKNLDEKPLRPYFSNLDKNLNVCLGSGMDKSQLIENNLTQQSSYILDHFWNSTFSDEWATHFWDSQKHFSSSDKRLSSLKNWEDASTEDPLFVLEDVDWLKHYEESFGDIIVSMLSEDRENAKAHSEIYSELAEEFFDNFKQTYGENISKLETEVTDKLADKLAEQLMESM